MTPTDALVQARERLLKADRMYQRARLEEDLAREIRDYAMVEAHGAGLSSSAISSLLGDVGQAKVVRSRRRAASRITPEGILSAGEAFRVSGHSAGEFLDRVRQGTLSAIPLHGSYAFMTTDVLRGGNDTEGDGAASDAPSENPRTKRSGFLAVWSPKAARKGEWDHWGRRGYKGAQTLVLKQGVSNDRWDTGNREDGYKLGDDMWLWLCADRPGDPFGIIGHGTVTRGPHVPRGEYNSFVGIAWDRLLPRGLPLHARTLQKRAPDALGKRVGNEAWLHVQNSGWKINDGYEDVIALMFDIHDAAVMGRA
jgi:hypothetical protein